MSCFNTFRAAVVERDELKEQVGQLDRDNRQLKFENETLLYRLRQRSLSGSLSTTFPTEPVIVRSPPSPSPLPPQRPVRSRARSFSSPSTGRHHSESLTRSVSLHCILHR